VTPALAEEIAETLRAIPEGDAQEATDKALVLSLLARGIPVIREDAPDRPDPHLVSYVLLTDGEKLLLVDHIKSGLWLPAGGHVEPGEHPDTTARREAMEELRIEAELLHDGPAFVTHQHTTGPLPHHDLSLWYILRGSETEAYEWDKGEFRGIAWFAPDEIPYARAEPQLRRGIEKLQSLGLLKTKDRPGDRLEDGHAPGEKTG
jgi:8-oxo-dGTP pyrophosphatase MutT (NUDIX family)